MKFYRCLLAFAAIIGLCSTSIAFADEQDNSRFDEELNERDFDALRDFLKAHRAEDIDESGSNLVMGGDIRTEWRHMTETCKGRNMRGHGAVVNGKPVSMNDFDIEFNLFFSYAHSERTWALAHVRYDNSAGVDDNGHPCFGKNVAGPGCCQKQAISCNGDPEGYHGSGNCDRLCLKKSYMGYNFYNDGCSRFDVELGRRGNLYNVFESNIQFLSRFDGILFEYDSHAEGLAAWYIHAAGFLVDERVNHFAWVAEIGLLNIADSDIDFKYSFIDWQKHGINRCFARNPKGFRFQNSQAYLAYHLNPDYLDIPVKFFGAFLINHAAEKMDLAHCHSRENLAWYVGVLLGKVIKEGDWAAQIQYQVVEGQSVPDGDGAGICRGNILDESFTTCARRGNSTNYCGWKLEGLYAFTDNLSLDTSLEWSKAENKHVGGTHSYSKFELEAIYAF